MLTKTFAKDALERALKTVAQTALSLLTVSEGIGILDVNYTQVLSVSLLAGLISLLTSIVSAQSKTNSASLVVEAKEIK